MTEQDNVAPLSALTPMEALVIRASMALAREGQEVTPAAVAAAIGMPEWTLRILFRVQPIAAPEGGKGAAHGDPS